MTQMPRLAAMRTTAVMSSGESDAPEGLFGKFNNRILVRGVIAFSSISSVMAKLFFSSLSTKTHLPPEYSTMSLKETQ